MPLNDKIRAGAVEEELHPLLAVDLAKCAHIAEKQGILWMFVSGNMVFLRGLDLGSYFQHIMLLEKKNTTTVIVTICDEDNRL